jgi:hypothetical protein
MNLSDYIQLPREQRIAHIDLSAECTFVCKPTTTKARRALLKHLGLENVKGRTIHCCHLCPNNSTSTQLCVNPQHLYFGTATENNQDKPPEARARTAKNLTPEACAKGNANRTHEERSAAAVKANANRTPDAKAENSRRMLAGRTFEGMSQGAKRVWEDRTPEERSNHARKTHQNRTPEERSATVRKAWETRRRNQQGG